jgi:hypothetical protein
MAMGNEIFNGSLLAINSRGLTPGFFLPQEQEDGVACAARGSSVNNSA